MLALLALSATVLGAPYTIQHSFSAGSPAVAAEVNANFEAAKTAIDDNDARITSALANVDSSGIEFASSDSSTSISDTASTPTDALSLSITVPGPGFIEVRASGYLAIGHTSGAGVSYVVCALKTDTNSPESATGRLTGSRRFVAVLSGEITGTHYPHIDTAGVLQVDTAGTTDLHLVCYRNSSSNSGSLIYRTLIATYHSQRL